MEGLKKVMAISALAIQLVSPVLILSQIAYAADTPPAIINNFCDVINKIKTITNILLVLLVTLAIVFIIMAAFKYLTASGDAEKVKAANRQILYAAVAVAVGLLATSVAPLVKFIIGDNTVECGNVQVQQ